MLDANVAVSAAALLASPQAIITNDSSSVLVGSSMVLSGEMKTGDALALMQRDTRHLAKRQLTWFRGDTSVRWFHPEAREEILICAKQFLFG